MVSEIHEKDEFLRNRLTNQFHFPFVMTRITYRAMHNMDETSELEKKTNCITYCVACHTCISSASSMW